MRARDREHRQPGRVVGALDEGQAGDDLGRVHRLRARSTRRRGGTGRRHQAEIALGVRDRGDHAGGPHVADERHGEAEMEADGIAHDGIAGRQVGMHPERRLDIGEGCDDDAPDALGGIERKDAAMALDQPAHHVGLARRPEGGAAFARLLDLDQPADDLAALHQQAVHRGVDEVDLGAQIGQRGRSGWMRSWAW